MSLFGSREPLPSNDYSWIGPGTDVTKADSGTLVAEEFTESTVPTGTPVFRDADGSVTPWAGQNPAGLRFVLHSQSVADDATAGLLYTGYVKVNNLPEDFTPVAGSAFVFDGALPAADQEGGE